MVFSTFLIHLLAISASCSPIYGSQPISLILLTNCTSSTTLFMVVPVVGAAYGICMAGVVCVAEPAMPSIIALTICTRSLASTYCGGTPVGIVDSCASDLSCCSAATGGTSSVWLGLNSPRYYGFPLQGFGWYYRSMRCRIIQGIFILPTLGTLVPTPPFEGGRLGSFPLSGEYHSAIHDNNTIITDP